jgi:hypothetical protein
VSVGLADLDGADCGAKVEAALKPGGFAAVEEPLRLLPGPHFDLTQGADEAAMPTEGPAPPPQGEGLLTLWTCVRVPLHWNSVRLWLAWACCDMQLVKCCECW